MCGRMERPGVGNLVGLGFEALTLHESAEWFGISKGFVETEGRTHAGAEFLFVVAAGSRFHLAGALEVDILALIAIGEQSVPDALDAEAEQACVFLGDLSFKAESTTESELIAEPLDRLSTCFILSV